MEGPTPVSALIHAATMVTAGVYMVARNAVLFSQAPDRDADRSRSSACSPRSWRRRSASCRTTSSACSRTRPSRSSATCFWRPASARSRRRVFHLMTHAFFKALLFLGSGSVIHAMAGEQDMQRMGGLKKFMPLTFATMMVGTLAIAGIPPLSGFFSKDEILYRTFLSRQQPGVALAVGAGPRHGAADRVLHVPADGADVLRRVPRAGVGGAGVARGRARGRGARRSASARSARHGQARSRRRCTKSAIGAADVIGDPSAAMRLAWHGPHESPRDDDLALVTLAARRRRRGLRRRSARRSAAATPSSISSSRPSPRSHGRHVAAVGTGAAHAAEPSRCLDGRRRIRPDGVLRRWSPPPAS